MRGRSGGIPPAYRPTNGETSLHTALRILSTPLYNYIDPLQGVSTINPLKHHVRTLQTCYKIQPKYIEHRYPYVTTPWWKPPQVTLDRTPEEATTQHGIICARKDTTCIYTDGSGIDGHVGAAAVVLLEPSSKTSPILRKRIHYMGKDTESIVYAAELKGISLALQTLQDDTHVLRNKVVIFTDNQSALQTVHKPGNTSGQYILKEIIQLLEKMTSEGIEVQLRWIPAHNDIPGNEAADQAAKQAARTLGRRRRTLLTAAKRTVSEAIHKEWGKIWALGKHGRHLYFLGTKPDKKILKLHRNLPRPISSVITQMKTEKIGLRAYLHSINRADSSQCTCNQGEQTVEHILLKCRNWLTERQEMWAGKRPTHNLKRLLNDPGGVVRAAKMMLKTGLLEHFTQAGAGQNN
jgi:ribonuclease HI